MHNRIVSREEWLEQRIALLHKEKEMTRLRDRLNAERLALPWVKIEKHYSFEGPEGRLGLADLFGGRSQLIVKHFMMAPGQEQQCVGCSFEVDHVDGSLIHLENHDVSFVAVARAPLAQIEAYKRRMGWRFRWVSSFGGDFNYDFNVSFTPQQIAAGQVYYNYSHIPISIEDLSGCSVFYRDQAGDIFHTYSSFGRGGEEHLTTYAFLDISPKGRNETGPRHNLTDWVRPHDCYGKGGSVNDQGRYAPAQVEAGCCAPAQPRR